MQEITYFSPESSSDEVNGDLFPNISGNPEGKLHYAVWHNWICTINVMLQKLYYILKKFPALCCSTNGMLIIFFIIYQKKILLIIWLVALLFACIPLMW